jgi:hypothetical protein
MLCIAMQSYTRTNNIPPEYQGTAPALTELYRVRTVQCLMIADLTKPVGLLLTKTCHCHVASVLTDLG